MDRDKLIELFLKFPGVGPRQAKRFVFFLAEESKEYADELAELIVKTKNEMKQCASCFRYFELRSSTYDVDESCSICSSSGRNDKLLMIVEKDVDLENIERTGVYDGKYFVLGGLLPLINGKETKITSRLKQLFEKVKKEKPAEIILATSATTEGENTNLYIERILEPLGAKISRLGRGLSTGAELEYSDSQTIENALNGRK